MLLLRLLSRLPLLPSELTKSKARLEASGMRCADSITQKSILTIFTLFQAASSRHATVFHWIRDADPCSALPPPLMAFHNFSAGLSHSTLIQAKRQTTFRISSQALIPNLARLSLANGSSHTPSLSLKTVAHPTNPAHKTSSSSLSAISEYPLTAVRIKLASSVYFAWFCPYSGISVVMTDTRVKCTRLLSGLRSQREDGAREA